MHVMGHPVHQMLIVYPAGLLMTAVAFDLLSWVSGDGTFGLVAYWLIVAGLVMGVLAAVFGFNDWRKIEEGTRARSVGLMHGAGNAIVLAIFAFGLTLRDGDVTSGGALALSLVGAALLGASAWLGGELVVRHGIGVNKNAHPDAPSSFEVPGDVVPAAASPRAEATTQAGSARATAPRSASRR